MNKEFIPYEQALALKELGYDKGSFACVLGDGFNIFDTRVSYNTNTKFPHCYDVPLYQQAFRWFREKYHIHGEPFYKGGLTKQTSWYDYKIYSTIDWIDNNTKQQWKTYEEAELECLKKLIEIVKKEQNESNIRI